MTRALTRRAAIPAITALGVGLVSASAAAQESTQPVPSGRSRVAPNRASIRAGRVTTEGDEIYYEVRGKGPPLLFIPGGLGDSAVFSLAAEILSNEYEVISFDRRGNSRSSRRDPQNFEISQQARDAAAVLAAAGHPSAVVLGSSGGALIALEMAKSHPRTVKVLVAHEPPAIRVLPDADKWLAKFADFYATALRESSSVALQNFLATIVTPPQNGPSRIPAEVEARVRRNFDQLMKRELLPFVNYKPDVESLKRNGVRKIIGIGQITRDADVYYGRSAIILAQQLECRLTTFPGHHVSYQDMPNEWAAALRNTLRNA